MPPEKKVDGDLPIFLQFYTPEYYTKDMSKGISSKHKMKNELSLQFLLKGNIYTVKRAKIVKKIKFEFLQYL